MPALKAPPARSCRPTQTLLCASVEVYRRIVAGRRLPRHRSALHKHAVGLGGLGTPLEDVWLHPQHVCMYMNRCGYMQAVDATFPARCWAIQTPVAQIYKSFCVHMAESTWRQRTCSPGLRGWSCQCCRRCWVTRTLHVHLIDSPVRRAQEWMMPQLS